MVRRIERHLTDQLLRRLRPQWIRNRLAGYERFAPLERLALPPGERLTVIAPHPDDESIGCGGLLALWAAAGRQADVIFLTEGEAGSRALRDGGLGENQRRLAATELRQTRRREAGAALARLGAEAVWLDGSDGALFRDETRLASALAARWDTRPPDLIAAPFPADRHPDHAAAARIVGRASHALDADIMILGYEVWSPAPATALLDITAVAQRKWDAIAEHRSQVASTDYVAAAQALNRYRAISGGIADGFAEAYWRASAREYAALTETLRV